MGLRLRVSDHSSPWRYDRCCLPACTNLGQIPTGTKISELNTIQGGVASPYLSSSLPFCLRFNVELRRSRLISTLQNSIQGLGLRVTLAGTAPARSQIISSPHVHRFVRPWFVLSLFPVSLVRTAQKHKIGENQRSRMRWSKDSIPQSRWGLHHVRAILEYRGSGHQRTKPLQCMRR